MWSQADGNFSRILKKSGAKKLREYVEYVNKAAKASPLHKENIKNV